MFEVLHSEELDVLTSAVYLAGLRMRERACYREWRTWLPARPGGELPETLDAAARIIEDIENAEGRALADLSDRELGPYERCIGDIMRGRRLRERPYDPGSAERRLQDLRQRYGGPGGTPLAPAGRSEEEAAPVP
jgi:hypothetical protein